MLLGVLLQGRPGLIERHPLGDRHVVVEARGCYGGIPVGVGSPRVLVLHDIPIRVAWSP